MSLLTLYKPLEHRVLGFDSLFRDLDRLLADSTTTVQGGFPPFNLFREKDGYLIEVALAGYKKEDIKIEHDKKNGLLTISHDASVKESFAQPEGREVLKNGIAKRSFVRQFTVADNVTVAGASMVDGMLQIALTVVEREEDKPLLIAVS